MTVKKITISVSEETLAMVQTAVDRGHATSVSAYFSETAQKRASCEQWLTHIETTYGPVSDEAMREAAESWGVPLPPRYRSAVAQ